MGVVPLTGIETALVNVGRAVVTPLFTRWLGGRREARERTLPLSELLKQKATDEFTRRRGERQIETVVDEVAERLAPLTATRFAALPQYEAVAAFEAVADTFRRADLSDNALFAADLDPARLAALLRADMPPAGLSAGAERLYDLALDDCCRCFTQFVVRTSPFGNRAAVEMLGRLTEITGIMSEALRHLTVDGLSPTEFRPRYAEVLTNKLNALELVGVETQFRPRTTLNVAYISLAVSDDGAGVREPPPAWEPTLLRHARPDSAGRERVERALAKRTRTLIRGEAGAGKSTLLRWLAVTAANQRFTGPLADWNGRVPFLVKLRSWPETLPAPEQFLTGVADPIAATMPTGWVHRQLEEGRALLLVDGVDELPAERRPKVRAWLRELLDAYPQSLAVVTSRPPAAPVRWLAAEDFESLTLERLTPADVRALIEQWHRAALSSPSLPCLPERLPHYEQSLLTQLTASRHLYRMAGNPLMAAMLCALNLDREASLPPDRMGIYQAAVDMLLHRRDTERGVHSALPAMSVRERLQLLQDLAWRISLNGRSELSRAEAIEYLRRRLAGMPRVSADARTVLTHLVERSGMLREPAVGRIDFVHRTFQEYLAAREAAEQDMGGMLAGQAHLDTWRETIVMAAGHGNSRMRRELIEGLLARADQEPRHRRTLVLLATACLETMPSLDPPTLIDDIHRRLDRLLPPRRPVESRSLYIVGEPILDRLPRSLDGLSDSQAVALIQTVSLVNGPRALEILAGYAHDPRYLVQLELADCWRTFDPDEYARRVLANAPLVGGYIPVREPALLGAARHLSNLRSIRANFNRSVDVAELSDAPALKEIYLYGDRCQNLGDLRRYPALEKVVVGATRVGAGDLRAMAGMQSLKELGIIWESSVRMRDIKVIADMAQLRRLDVRLHPEVTDVSALTSMQSLEYLFLDGEHSASFGPPSELRRLGLPLAVLGADGLSSLNSFFPRLDELELSGVKDDWDLAAIKELPSLTRLIAFPAASRRLETLEATPRLTQITLSPAAPVDLGPLARLPQIEQIEIWDVEDSIDLTPFRSWKGRSAHHRRLPAEQSRRPTRTAVYCPAASSVDVSRAATSVAMSAGSRPSVLTVWVATSA